ncbi:hypothetical protein OG819_47040 [Streptomyces sp. NBC_01549]|uniref:hypothetical protein n=2 Tax=unclassified Streptomyces TaxID=2593676 RepID=UPI0022550D05|nr:hypothetical protein [Streptomyces sp. NBC_01549]MCX4596924.1 hypothetical protein [Streptomyces sp. NBC_01549]
MHQTGEDPYPARSPAAGNAVFQLTATMEALGGSVTALDVISSDADRLGINVTIAATSTAHDTGSAGRGHFTRQRPPIHG